MQIEVGKDHADEMRRCLIDCDVPGLRKLWHHIYPKNPKPPQTDHEALCVLHYARTQTITINLRLRAYSHYWLLDHGLPSALPDELKAKAARLYPHIVDAVGVACKSSFPEVANMVQQAMVGAVLDCYAEGKRDPSYVKPIMMERRAQAKKALHGILSDKATQDLMNRTLKSLRKP